MRPVVVKLPGFSQCSGTPPTGRETDPKSAAVAGNPLTTSTTGRTFAPWQFSVWILTVFAALAFALAAVGLFSEQSIRDYVWGAVEVRLWHRAEPHRQRRARVLEDRGRRHRCLPSAGGALRQEFANRPALQVGAPRTPKAAGSSHDRAAPQA